MKLTGAEILMECLLEQDVDTVFGYPGGTILYVYDALVKYRGRINHYLTAHEQGAAVKNGLEMLLLQAFASYEIWNSPL